MVQPNKDKKKPNGTPVAGTSKQATGIELSDQEFKRLEKEKAAISDPKNKENIKVLYGSERSKKSGEFEAKKYEKVYIKGDRAKGVKSKVVDGSGKVISEELADSDKDKENERIYNRDKKATEKAREYNTDYLNFKESGKEGKTAEERRKQQEFRDEQQAKLRDDKIKAQADLAAAKTKKGGY